MKYAFIDVQNTDTTTKQLLGFEIDWQRLYKFLKDDWNCEKVFFYSGLDENNLELAKEFSDLERSGCIVRSKVIFSYKNKSRQVETKCPKCGVVFKVKILTGHNRKANCDVDLTVDAMEYIGDTSEVYLFSGDGDFEYLIRKAVDNGTKIHIVSSAKKIRTGERYYISRFSTKLRNLINEKRYDISLIDLDVLKMRIKR